MFLPVIIVLYLGKDGYPRALRGLRPDGPQTGFLTTFTMLARDRMTVNDMSWLLIKVFFGYACNSRASRMGLTTPSGQVILVLTWLSR